MCFLFLQTIFRPEAFYPSLIALWDRPDQSDGLDSSSVQLLAGLWRCALKGASHSSFNSSKGYSDRLDSGWHPRTDFYFAVVVVAAGDDFRGANAQGLIKSQWDGPKIPEELAVALMLASPNRSRCYRRTEVLSRGQNPDPGKEKLWHFSLPPANSHTNHHADKQPKNIKYWAACSIFVTISIRYLSCILKSTQWNWPTITLHPTELNALLKRGKYAFILDKVKDHGQYP